MTVDALAPAAATRCPDENALTRFARGGREAELPAMEAHLDACESCRRAVAAAASEHTLPAAPPAQELTPGMRVGRYEIERELGRGGMGVVYLARDVTLDRRVALKLLHARHDEAAQARLLREAQVMAKLAHPNVVPVFELGDWRGELYLAMELVDGLTLDAWLKGARRSPEQILEKFLEAGRGLAAAHAAGVVHRDFKPANVLVGRDGRVRVTDFGLSRPGPAVVLPPLASPLVTREGTLVGTLAYMAPEQLDGKAADERSDQFAFCVALAEALGGTRPFEGDTWSTLALAHARPPALASGLAGRVRAVLRRGLEGDPAKRFSSMSGLLAALERRPSAGARRAWVLAGSLALGALVVLAAREAEQRAPLRATGLGAYVPVVMAARDILAGTTVTMDMVLSREMPATYVTQSNVKSDSVGYIVGQKLLVDVYRGDPLLWTQLEVASAPAVPVVVAAADLAEGTTIAKDLLSERTVEPALATESVVKPGAASSLLGQRLMVSVRKGDLLLWSQFAATAGPTRLQSPAVMQVVLGHKAGLERCMAAERQARPNSHGTLVMSWRVKADGAVYDVGPQTDRFVDSELGRCLTREISTWKFPPGEDGWVEFPLKF